MENENNNEISLALAIIAARYATPASPIANIFDDESFMTVIFDGAETLDAAQF